MQELDDAVRESEEIRAQLERSRNQTPFWPDRRVPKRWEHDARNRESQDKQPQRNGDHVLAANEAEVVGE